MFRTRWSSSPGNPHLYPGAIIDVGEIDEVTNVSDAYCKTQRVLPPGVPLDEDLVDKLLQLLVLHNEWHEQSHNYTGFVIKEYQEAFEAMRKTLDLIQMEKTLDLIQMEAMWRKIQRNKK